MAKSVPLISNFGSGEVSPYFHARVDAERYKTALYKLLNYHITIQGALTRRMGSVYVAPNKDSTKKIRLQSFEYSTTQAYILEFGETYVRFYKDNSPILETGTAITGVTLANPLVITAVAHGMNVGDDFEVYDSGSTLVGTTQLLDRRFRITATTVNTITVGAVDATSYTAWVSGGFVARVYTTKPSKTITGITAANPAVVTSVAHGHTTGDKVYLYGIGGMTQLNNNFFTITVLTADTFSLQSIPPSGMTGVNIDSSAYTAYTSGGTIAQTPYQESELFDLKFAQSADVLYITHPNYPPCKLSRTGHTAWTFNPIDFVDGPYLPANRLNDGSSNTTLTITPSATTGTCTLTASSALWSVTDIGRLVRLKNGANWGFAKIYNYTSSTVVSAHIQSGYPFSATTATTSWRLGVYCNTMGFPRCVLFHEDRLCFAGATQVPQRYDMSTTSDYENFTDRPLNDTTPIDSNAFGSTLSANDVNSYFWMTSDEKGMLAGTPSGEWIIRPSSLSSALTPANVSQKKIGSYGSKNLQPVQAGRATLYVQRAGKKLRELQYFYDSDGHQSTDLSLLSEHITGAGINQLAFQRNPQSFMWAVRADGQLISLTYERDIEALKAGWSRHVLGGYGSSAQTDPIVESVAVIPSADGLKDEVWVSVKRYINGNTVRYVEYLTNIFDDLTEQKDCVAVDCSLSYDDPKTITGATKANPGVITAVAHGFTTGDLVLISDIAGMTDLNTNTYTITVLTADTFSIGVDTSSFGTYISGGYVRKYVTTISGLWHLIGETVDVLIDGATHPPVVVSSTGSVTLSNRATTVHVGYKYNSDVELLPFHSGSQNGTALGKFRRTQRVNLMFHRSLGGKLGLGFDNLFEITFRTSSDALTRAPMLYTGFITESVESGIDRENRICFRQDQPLPSTILAFIPLMDTQDWE